MTTAVAQILNEVQQLSPAERVELRRRIVEDIPMSDDLTDGQHTIKDGDELCLYLLDKAHVALVPGGAFGDPNCIRLSYAASEKDLVEALRRIKETLSGLKETRAHAVVA